jgi:hypothetical protein
MILEGLRVEHCTDLGRNPVMTRVTVLLLALLLATAPASALAEEPGFYEIALTRDLLLLQRQDAAARMVLDGRIRIWGWPWHEERDLSVGDTLDRADHHASVLITVTAIDDLGVHMRADSSFEWEDRHAQESESFVLAWSTPWQIAACEGDLVGLQQHMGQRKQIDRRDDQGRSALMVAVYRGHADAVTWLLENRADVHAISQGTNGVTPLMVAARHQPALVPLLLEAGANPNQLNLNDDGPLYVGMRDPEVLRALFDAGADVDSLGAHKAFGWTVKEGPVESIQVFIDRGVDVNAEVFGRSILECLAPDHVRRAEPGVKALIRQLLIDAGATIAP